MPIPSLDRHGLLPPGVHNCTLTEIGQAFGKNIHRQKLFQYFKKCLRSEIRPAFDDPIYVNGSFVTDKDQPDDVDVALDLRDAPDEKNGKDFCL